MHETTTNKKNKALDIPLPREHGAWVMLYAPVIIAAFRIGSVSFTPFLLLLCVITGAFLSRHAAELVLRGKGDDKTKIWLFFYLLITFLSGGSLMLRDDFRGLWMIFCAAMILFALHAWLSVIPSRKRLDRTVWGELLGIAALCLTGPATWIVCTTHAPFESWLEWGACLLFFGSGIFHVKMLLESGKLAKQNTPEMYQRIVGPSRLYHLLVIPLALLPVCFVGARGLWIAISFLPVTYRAWKGILHPSYRIPPLRKVGYMETLYSVWFICCIII